MNEKKKKNVENIFICLKNHQIFKIILRTSSRMIEATILRVVSRHYRLKTIKMWKRYKLEQFFNSPSKLILL